MRNVLLSKRLWWKALSWRAIAISITIVFLLKTGMEMAPATTLGISINLVKTVAFYAHERLWQ
jgi:uncharacterized membrane protein